MPTHFGDSQDRPEGRGFREPIVSPEAPLREVAEVGFADLVRMLAESIADAQVSLDRTSAALVEELAQTRVRHIPEIRENIDAEGNVRYDQVEGPPISLLELGIEPTFYQFSQATVEVSIDVRFVEERQESGSERRVGIVAGTTALQAERRLNRDVTAHSKLTATLVPVPMPAKLEPSRTTTVRDA